MQVEPVYSVLNPDRRRRLLRAGIGARQLLDLEVLEAALGAFRFQGEIALARVAFADAGDVLAVDARA